MIVEVDDFGIEWQKSDKVVHKADFDDLIKAYEKLEKIEEIVDIVNKSNDRTDATFIHQNNMMYGFDDIRRIVKEV